MDVSPYQIGYAEMNKYVLFMEQQNVATQLPTVRNTYNLTTDEKSQPNQRTTINSEVYACLRVKTKEQEWSGEVCGMGHNVLDCKRHWERRE
jgi:hypothetical protein